MMRLCLHGKIPTATIEIMNIKVLCCQENIIHTYDSSEILNQKLKFLINV